MKKSTDNQPIVDDVKMTIDEPQPEASQEVKLK